MFKRSHRAASLSFFNAVTLSLALLVTSALINPALADNQPPKQISVSGFGEVLAAPDKALISVSIDARSKRIDDAREQVAKVIKQVLAVTDELNIERQYVNTSASSIRPEYRYHDSKRHFEGYYVARQVMIDLRDLEKIGSLNEKLLDAGINNVSPPQLGSSKAAELKREAIKRATADAKLNASAIAEALGVVLGSPLQVSANANHHQPHPRAMMMKSTMADAAVESGPAADYETGEIRFSASANANFAIE